MTIEMPPVTNGLIYFADGDTHLATYGEGVGGAMVNRSATPATINFGTWNATTSPTPSGGWVVNPNAGHALMVPVQMGFSWETARQETTEVVVLPGGRYDWVAFLQIFGEMPSILYDYMHGDAGIGMFTDLYSNYGFFDTQNKTKIVSTLTTVTEYRIEMYLDKQLQWSAAATSNIFPFVKSATTRPCYAYLLYDRVLSEPEALAIHEWIDSWSITTPPGFEFTCVRNPTDAVVTWTSGDIVSSYTPYYQSSPGGVWNADTLYTGSWTGSLTIPNLLPERQYFFVLENGPTGIEQASIVYGFNRTPVEVQANSIENFVLLTWPEDNLRYAVYRDDVLMHYATQSYWVDTTAVTGVEYTYRIQGGWYEGSVVHTHTGDVAGLLAQVLVSHNGNWVDLAGVSTMVSDGSSWVPLSGSGG